MCTKIEKVKILGLSRLYVTIELADGTRRAIHGSKVVMFWCRKDELKDSVASRLTGKMLTATLDGDGTLVVMGELTAI